jgi:hypothetical protein
MSNDYEKHVKPGIDNIFRRMKNQPDKPYLLKVQHATVTGGGTVTSDQAIDLLICSACRRPIDQTWDHEDWCELFVPEPLADWLQKGAK